MGCSQSTSYKSFEAPASEPRRKQLRTTAEEEEVIYKTPMPGENVCDTAQALAAGAVVGRAVALWACGVRIVWGRIFH